MPHFVHIAPEPAAKKIRRSGIAPSHIKWWIHGYPHLVWAFPVLPSYTLTHQWIRELKRWGRTSLVAITFRVPDSEPVFARHYLNEPVAMTAAEAVGMVRALADPRGFEVIVPRRIQPSEIVRINTLNRGFGWRYSPSAKNNDRYPCDCPVCAPRGEVKAKRYRNRIAELQQRWEAKRARR